MTTVRAKPLREKHGEEAIKEGLPEVIRASHPNDGEDGNPWCRTLCTCCVRNSLSLRTGLMRSDRTAGPGPKPEHQERCQKGGGSNEEKDGFQTPMRRKLQDVTSQPRRRHR
eukprot:CAMPEP_0181403296 /NCGR_PEP_ID=MMETSP1110-20121109/3633_1 /TAXON_ID=174948 /ORGANISM="Symbiodinium sp., Strain CCMP421" /LENGTH=111 /DNA_ID=CAMNT_0023525573 /DNA_START=154 /DNA_END=489 /DNA_ORIENTATION=+